MNISKILAIVCFNLLIFCIFAPFALTGIEDPCRAEAQNLNSIVQNYRGAIRDVSSNCTKESGDCETAKSIVDDALIQMINAHQVLMDVCVGSIPPPPPPQPPTLPGDIVITEFMADPASVGDLYGEWFEIYNPTSTDFNLNGIIVRDAGTDLFVINAPLVIPAKEFVVLGNNSDSLSNGGVLVNFEYSNFTLSNTSDEIEIMNGTTSLDKITYSSPTAGYSKSLDPDYFDYIHNDNDYNWCNSVGTPGVVNEECP